MGLFDKFRKNKEQQNVPQKIELPFEVEFTTTRDGRMQVDFYDKNADFKQFYDMTRLVANPEPLKAYKDNNVLNCMVSWYGREDADILGDNEVEIGRKTQYRGVLAQIDINLLQTDANYCYQVMKNLLEKKRVEKYLDRGLEENPQTPCGKYIGGIRETEKGYSKVFDARIGRQSHNSSLMVNRRLEHRQQQETKRQQQMEDKRKQMERLQGETDSLSR